MGLSTFKLIGIGLGALALIAAVLWFRSVLNERAELRTWQTEVVTATREASANPKLDKKLVAQQIRLLGDNIKQCKGALASQSAAVNRLGEETERLQGLAAEASRKAAQRVDKAMGVSERLLASSRSSGPHCEPSAALKGAWQ